MLQGTLHPGFPAGEGMDFTLLEWLNPNPYKGGLLQPGVWSIAPKLQTCV